MLYMAVLRASRLLKLLAALALGSLYLLLELLDGEP
jgi:hypothetical protein